MDPLRIVIIGTGNTATVLGRKLKKAGHQIIQVYGRDSMAASELAYELETESTNYWNVVNKEADLYILAVSDIAINEVQQELRLPAGTLVHTAASVPMDILKGRYAHYGVFYPLQSMRKELKQLPEIPIIIDASDEETRLMLDHLGHSIAERVEEIHDAKRIRLHMAAVFCNNFVNHLYTLAEDYCREEGLDFTLLLPLIHETAARLSEASPAQLQTGPALRGDETTMDRHLELLAAHPQMQKIYQIMSQSIRSRGK